MCSVQYTNVRRGDDKIFNLSMYQPKIEITTYFIDDSARAIYVIIINALSVVFLYESP